MKILIASPTYPPERGNHAAYIKELCPAMGKEHCLTVVVYAVVAYSDIETSHPEIRVLPLDKRRSLIIRFVKFFLKILKESGDADIIYVQNTVAAGLPVALASLITDKPFVLKFVGDEAWERAVQRKFTRKQLGEFLDKPDGDLKTRIILFVQAFVLKKSSAVITSSKFLGRIITEKYKLRNEKVVVNYNPPEKQEILPFETQTRKHQIFTTGKLTNLSGVDIGIKAVAILKNEFPDVKFIIAGDGPETENLKRLTLSLNLSQNVEFLGKISRAEAWKIRKESEICVFNLTDKMSPQKILANFVAQTPTIAADIPEISEIIDNEKTGLLVKTYDEKSLASAIKRLFNNKTVEQNIIRNGTEALKTKFSWNAHIKILNDIFKEILD